MYIYIYMYVHMCAYIYIYIYICPTAETAIQPLSWCSGSWYVQVFSSPKESSVFQTPVAAISSSSSSSSSSSINTNQINTIIIK